VGIDEAEDEDIKGIAEVDGDVEETAEATVERKGDGWTDTP
jgi:hypothetical protein